MCRNSKSIILKRSVTCFCLALVPLTNPRQETICVFKYNNNDGRNWSFTETSFLAEENSARLCLLKVVSWGGPIRPTESLSRGVNARDPKWPPSGRVNEGGSWNQSKRKMMRASAAWVISLSQHPSFRPALSVSALIQACRSWWCTDRLWYYFCCKNFMVIVRVCINMCTCV